MRKKIFLLCYVVAALLCGCTKDDDSEASYKDKDWFNLQDNPDPLKHLAYQMFQKIGIPIFCNDTIGQWENGYDKDGNPYICYETLDVNYKLTGGSTAGKVLYQLENDQEKLKIGIQFTGEELYPLIPKKVYVHSFLLTKALSFLMNGKSTELIGCIGFNTFVIGGIDKIGEMTRQEKKFYTGEILGVLVGNYLCNKYDEDLITFYDVSEKAEFPGKSPYTYTVYATWVSHDKSLDKPWEWVGFLGYDTSQKPWANKFRSYSKEKDVQEFVKAYFSFTEDEFRAEYSEHNYILEKYEIIKELMKLLY